MADLIPGSREEFDLAGTMHGGWLVAGVHLRLRWSLLSCAIRIPLQSCCLKHVDLRDGHASIHEQVAYVVVVLDCSAAVEDNRHQ